MRWRDAKFFFFWDNTVGGIGAGGKEILGMNPAFRRLELARPLSSFESQTKVCQDDF